MNRSSFVCAVMAEARSNRPGFLLFEGGRRDHEFGHVYPGHRLCRIAKRRRPNFQTSPSPWPSTTISSISLPVGSSFIRFSVRGK